MRETENYVKAATSKSKAHSVRDQRMQVGNLAGSGCHVVVLPAMAIAVAYASPAGYDADTDSAVRAEEDCSEVTVKEDCSEVTVRAGLTLP